MRVFWIVLVVCFSSGLQAQFHEDVFPGQTGDVLLQNLVNSYKPGTVYSYGDARRKMFGELDNYNDIVYCVYSGDSIYVDPNAVDPKTDAFDKGFNTEHTFPQSKGAINNAKSDVHHLFPTRVDVNGYRGHLAFSEIPDNETDEWYFLSGVYNNIPTQNIDSYSEKDFGDEEFEAPEAHKGNVARAMMYFYTMYQDYADDADLGYFQSMVPSLCEWHYGDPVDQKEWDRTYGIASFQENKPNPFVLDCTLPERSFCAGMGYVCNPNHVNSLAVLDYHQAVPNPTFSHFALEYVLPQSAQNGFFQLIDVFGKEVMSTPVGSAPAGANRLPVSVNNLPVGMYYYQLRFDSHIAQGKLIKM